MPNAEEYTKITTLYDEALQTKLMPPRKECASPKKEKSAAKKDIEEEKNKVHIYLGSVPIYGGWTPHHIVPRHSTQHLYLIFIFNLGL